MSFVFLKQYIFHSSQLYPRSRESAFSYTLHNQDLESSPTEIDAPPIYEFLPDDQLIDIPEAVFDAPQTTRLNSRIISDATIGLSDGLTVPFALSAGLSALGSTKVVIFGGMAELIAGAISMGLGGYLGARSEAAAYEVTLSKSCTLISTAPKVAESLVRSVFASYRIPQELLDPILTHLEQSPPDFVDFLMRFHYELPKPASERAYVSAITIAAGYFFGGLLPLLPYFFVEFDELSKAFWWSVLTMALALFAFGYVKTCIVQGWMGRNNILSGVQGAIQMMAVGGVAASAAMGLVKAFT